jgi:predicted transcriptional regulator
MVKKKPNQGARKTEALTLRLDPKVRFLIDLIARQKRQSITGVIESAIELYATNYSVKAGLWDEELQDDSVKHHSLYKICNEVYSTDDSFRFMMLYWVCPQLLSYEEKRLSETIYSSRIFWDEYPHSEDRTNDIDTDVLREHWEQLLEHVEEHRSSPVVVPYEPK